MRQNKLSARWVWRWKRSTHAGMIAFYIVGRSMKSLRNALFVDLTDSIVGKMVMMMTIATEERAGLKMCFSTFLSFLV
jgi:hypothetical protein